MPSRRSSNFTTSGLHRLDGSIQRKPQMVTGHSFRQIGKFERDCLFSNPTYVGMSAEDQALIQQDAQEAFFAWIMSNRVGGKSTTPMQKRKMYEKIVQKLLISFEIQSVARPAFVGAGAFELPVVDDPSSSCVSPFEGLLVTGVIPFSQHVSKPMPTCCLPNSQPSQPMSDDCSHSDGEEGKFSDGCMLYSQPLSPTLESSSFMSKLPTFAQWFLPTDAVEDKCDKHQEQPSSASVFQMLHFPSVAETLQQISEIQAQISRVVNDETVDMSLGPTDWQQSAEFQPDE